MSEQHRIERAVRGDMDELAVLLHENYSFLYKYALKLTMSSSNAEDLVQDTMVRCMEKIHTYNGSSRFSSWLITIATRLFYDKMRRKKVESKWREQEQAVRQLRYQMESSNMEWTAALELLGELSYEQRTPIVLKYYYGYQVNEIADMLNVQAGTIKSRMHYGLEKLRKEWKQDE
jgi:RNA polymerase sigma-70 factor, ECF subfamily